MVEKTGLCPVFSVSETADLQKSAVCPGTLIGHKRRFFEKSDTEIEVDFVSEMGSKITPRKGPSGAHFCAAKSGLKVSLGGC